MENKSTTLRNVCKDTNKIEILKCMISPLIILYFILLYSLKQSIIFLFSSGRQCLRLQHQQKNKTALLRILQVLQMHPKRLIVLWRLTLCVVIQCPLQRRTQNNPKCPRLRHLLHVFVLHVRCLKYSRQSHFNRSRECYSLKQLFIILIPVIVCK